MYFSVMRQGRDQNQANPWKLPVCIRWSLPESVQTSYFSAVGR